MANVYLEVTSDNHYPISAYAENNQARYILISAMAHDMYYEFREKYRRDPHSSWFHKHFEFTKKKPKKLNKYVSSATSAIQC